MSTSLTDPIPRQMPPPAARLANRSAALVTTIYVTLGYASQILLLVTRHSASDLSPIFTGLGFLTFGSWVVAGWLMTPRNYGLVIPNAIGAAFSAVLVALWALYR